GDPDRFWAVFRPIVQPIALALAPAAAYGVERVPRDRGAVLAANHFSGIDHPLIGCFVPGTTYFLAKSELFEIPVIGDWLELMGVISIRRGELDSLPRNRAGYTEAGELVRAELVRLWRLAAEAAAAGLPPELPDGTPRNGPVSD